MREWICTIAGLAGGFIAAIFGGWDSALATLVVFMGIDFVTGLVTAVMGKSKHSRSGALNSKAGWIGLAKKFCILLMVVVGVRIDILLGTTYIRDTVCISFCLNELLSIIENTTLMGIPYPPALKNAIEVLQKQTGRKDDNDD
ncbi:MAG TPA: phage holin family protein [Ruminococcus sp.]|nr:phage holin family protein [Ruminococcus sp.]